MKSTSHVFLANICGIVGWRSQTPNPVNFPCGLGGLSEADGKKNKIEPRRREEREGGFCPIRVHQLLKRRLVLRFEQNQPASV